MVQLTFLGRVQAPHNLPMSGSSIHSLSLLHPLKVSCNWTQPYTSSKNTLDKNGVRALGPHILPGWGSRGSEKDGIPEKA